MSENQKEWARGECPICLKCQSWLIEIKTSVFLYLKCFFSTRRGSLMKSPNWGTIQIISGIFKACASNSPEVLLEFFCKKSYKDALSSVHLTCLRATVQSVHKVFPEPFCCWRTLLLELWEKKLSALDLFAHPSSKTELPWLPLRHVENIFRCASISCFQAVTKWVSE